MTPFLIREVGDSPLGYNEFDFFYKMKNTDPLMAFARLASRYQKTQNCALISNPLKKLLKNAPKKVISKTSLTNMSKSEKSAYFRHVFANNFFVCIFSNLFQWIRNQREILRFFDTHIEFLKKNILFALISTSFTL